ncbi:hypothetical protein [Sandarakinorhabdus rubra]|uniref:hypothetical protein n=1 Tax=Sandarakinorhabdus rubra TaxID=2672568 RepID=UPI0013DD4270|nr:hypothetical protein [Sandarakinorhabdus rubra]
MSLFARLEAALARLEQQQQAARQSLAAAAAAHDADRRRLAQLEGAAADALKALDTLIGQE